VRRNEEKAIAHVIKEIPNSVMKLFLTTQLIILLKWQQQLVPPYFRKQERVWLCLLKRNGVHFEPRNKTRYCRFLDGDYSDYPELTQLIAPILENNIDLLPEWLD
jgi:hypothetical protein